MKLLTVLTTEVSIRYTSCKWLWVFVLTFFFCQQILWNKTILKALYALKIIVTCHEKISAAQRNDKNISPPPPSKKKTQHNTPPPTPSPPPLS